MGLLPQELKISYMDTSQIEFTGNGSAYFYTHSWSGAGHDARLVFVKDGNEKSTVAIPYGKGDSNYATFETPLPDGRFTQSNLTLNRFFVNNSAASTGVYNGPTQLTKNSAGSYTGITNFDPDYELANYTSSTINTGWLPANTKLATLSDTDTTNAASTDLLGGIGNFTDANAWTVPSGWSLSSNIATGSAVTAYLLPASNGILTTGKQYAVTVTQSSYTSGTVYLYMGTGAPNGYYYASLPSTAGTYTFTLTAYNSNFGIYGANYTGVIDNVTVSLAESDHSVNANGLQTFGTVTKTAVATGADLVGYTPSGTSYLRQPSAGGLTLTSDFSITWWQKYDGSGGTYDGWQIVEDDTSSASAYNKVVLSAMHEISSSQYLIRGASITASAVANGIASGAWTCMTITKTGGKISLYTNGKLSSTTAGTCATPSNPYSLEILKWNYANSAYYSNNSAMALFRTSNTIPTAEQIAKMYRDEKYLFATNAKATLYGNSDSVTALAYDDDTELLHVGTSAGRSEFQGLNRVNNTTDAVGTAISASNGFIVED